MVKKTPFFDMSYARFLGTWGWIFHRLSGLALIFYLTLHIWVINTLTKGPEAFDTIMATLGSPFFKILELGLWAIILFHAFNGIRIVAIDFFKGSLIHKKLFWVLTILAFILWVAGSLVIMSHI